MSRLLIVKTLALNSIKIRYKRSALGFLWSLLNPLLNIGLIGVVFSEIMHMPYKEFVIFLAPGIIAWNLFANTIQGCALALINNEGLILNTNIDRLTFPVVVLCTMLIDFLLTMGLLLVVLTFFLKLKLAWLIVPLAVVLIAMFALGAGLIVAVANTYWRDVAHIVNIVLQMLFFLTPVIYPASRLSSYKWVATLNPLSYLIEMFRSPIYYGVMPSMETIGISVAASAIALLGGYCLFRKCENNIVFRL